MRNIWFEQLDPRGFQHIGDNKIRLYKGGFIGDVLGAVSDVVSDVVDFGADVINGIPVVGDIADDVLGIDPNGGGLIPTIKTVGNIAATSLLTGGAVDALGSAFGGWGGGASALGEGVQVFDDGSQLFTGANDAITGGVDAAGNAFNFADGVASYTGGGALGGAPELNFGGELADVADTNALTNYNAATATPGLLDNVTAKDVSNAAKVGNSLLGGGGATGAVAGLLGAGGASGGATKTGTNATSNNNALLTQLGLLGANQNEEAPKPIEYAPVQLFRNY